MFAWIIYDEAIGEDSNDPIVEGGGGELKVAKVVREDLGGHGHDIVEHVDDHKRGSEVDEQLYLDDGGKLEAAGP